MTAAERGRDDALDEVGAKHTAGARLALGVIGRWADKGAPFTANDTRADMREAGVPTPVIGRAYKQAVADGRIRRLDDVQSTDPGTHGKRIARYIASGRAVRPVAELPTPRRRDERGRFASGPEHIDGQTDIFDFIGSA